MQTNEFEPDPYLGLDKVAPSTLREGFYGNRENDLVEQKLQFGMPLISSWRLFPESFKVPYVTLASKIASSLDDSSGFKLKRANSESSMEEMERETWIHIYPFDDLHVTVATFRTLFDPALADAKDCQSFKKYCIEIVKQASKRESWPRDESKMCFRPKEIRVGKKNAIILWEETTGTLMSIRQCLSKEVKNFQKHGQLPNKAGEKDLNDILSSMPEIPYIVPNIVHSTFLRFWRSPTNQEAECIQKIFDECKWVDTFPIKIEVDSVVKLVCEDVPCMHVLPDKSHVLWESK